MMIQTWNDVDEELLAAIGDAIEDTVDKLAVDADADTRNKWADALKAATFDALKTYVEEHR